MRVVDETSPLHQQQIPSPYRNVDVAHEWPSRAYLPSSAHHIKHVQSPRPTLRSEILRKSKFWSGR